MSNPKAMGLSILAIVALAIAARAIHTSRTLEDLQSAAAATQQRREEVAKVERARLTGEIQAIETSIQSSRADGDRRMRRAKAAETDAAARHNAARQHLEKYKKEHWFDRWRPGSEVSKTIDRLEEEAKGIACAGKRFGLEQRAAGAAMNREVGALSQRKTALEMELASLAPLPAAAVLPTWWDVFFGRWTQPAGPDLPNSRSRSPNAAPAAVLFTYAPPAIQPGPAPIRKTTVFELRDIRSASELSKWLGGLGKQAQDVAIRVWKKKEDGSLVDLTVGCRTVSLNKPVAEALWAKYQYFLAQTDYQCEIEPTSDFREYLKQRTLKKGESKSGTPIANPIDSKHVIGDAVDQSARCQSGIVPFDFDQAGRVIVVRTDGRGKAVHDPAVREAIVNRRKAEFADDYARLMNARGDIKAWEDAQYEAALHELLRFRPGTGIYGAHVMSFEAGLKAGLVGAFCGIRHDPIHSEPSIGGSRAECGGKRNGSPACYRVDATGQPDCWRGSPKWNEMVDAERRRSWGSRYAQLYGPDRLDRYLPRPISQVGTTDR